jgi:ABC-type multidrug transport system ATPase subunit
MIEAERLTKRYGRTVAVDGIDLQVKPGVPVTLADKDL